ncbi:Autoinducer 2 sensor kinase/phosphatase LuxQ [Planctomycetes bacterium Poly30]|uniref:histidine kinase n=1 Tax=Saltatorellus ferox TaxID=2528018 RepID=A0A518EUJ5_9BACT|nr:Autoinducer 2 sensor kinase/phosphatase LuxQ [Planctomycetes bacterium Poly30]
MSTQSPFDDSTPSGVEQELLSLVLELIPFVVFWKDRDSRYLGCNAAFAGLAGLSSPSAIVGLQDYDLPWTREESEAYRADDRAVIESEKPKLHIVETQLNSEGRRTWIYTSKVPLRNGAGEVIGIVGIFADITEQRENEEELLRTRGHLQAAIHAMDSGIVMYDREDRFVFCNDEYRKIYDTPEHLLRDGEPYEAVLWDYAVTHPEVGDPATWVTDRLEQHRRCETEWFQQLGTRTIRVSDTRTKGGGIVSLRTDVTAMKQIEEELRDAKRAAEDANAAKSAFLANMSHEIRTPMSAILGFTELLLEEATDESSRQALDTIKRNGESLLGLINDILDLSKVEAGKLEATLESCSPFDLLNDVFELLAVRAREKGVDLVMERNGPLPVAIESDPSRLRQILVNLAGNALKFTDEGCVTLRASWQPEAVGGKLVFEVQDTGIGMTDEQLGRIFRPFGQADSSTTRNFGGTGLGLTISSRLAELLGGTIEARSEAGVGSTFALALRVDESVEIQQGAGPRAPREAAAPAAPSIRLDGLRILLAEDGRDNQRLITRVLTRAGAEVEVCGDGIAAVEAAGYGSGVQAGSLGFDVILMDMQMPRLDGYGAARRLRQRGCAVPIVALTANAMSGDRELCLEAGCDDYLTKPLRFADLVGACARWGQVTEQQRSDAG